MSKQIKDVISKDNGGEVLLDKRYDNKGNLVHYKSSDGFEYNIEYDKHGNMIHFKSNKMLEWWAEYDKNNKLIKFKTNIDDLL